MTDHTCTEECTERHQASNEDRTAEKLRRLNELNDRQVAELSEHATYYAALVKELEAIISESKTSYKKAFYKKKLAKVLKNLQAVVSVYNSQQAHYNKLQAAYAPLQEEVITKDDATTTPE